MPAFDPHRPSGRSSPINIVSGLAEGQVIQRLRPSGKGIIRLMVDGTQPGLIRATIANSNGKPLPEWDRRTISRMRGKPCTFQLDDIPAGGPYSLLLECCSASWKVVKAFFVGDVWILAGQSNMQGYGRIFRAPKGHPLIRCFSMRRVWRRAAEPLHVLAESPDACRSGGNQCSPAEGEDYRQPNRLKKGTGPGLFFAREMLARSGVPQGLIPAAQGGTALTKWEPRSELGRSISLYGSLLDSVRATGQPVAGILWYQGEGDTNPDAAPLYTPRMRALVKALRDDLQQPGLPWIAVQLARAAGIHTSSEESCWNDIQEQQRLLPRNIRNFGVVAAIDLPLEDSIHVASDGHAILGRRLALEALRLSRSEKKALPPPELQSISPPFTPARRADGHRECGLVVDVTYRNVRAPFRSCGMPGGFAIVDKRGTDQRTIHKLSFRNNTVRLHLTSFTPGSLLCYGPGCFPDCNIMDARGHALPVFAPLPVGKPAAYLPFLTAWKVRPPLLLETPLDRLKHPPANLPPGEEKIYREPELHLNGLVNEHPRWTQKRGVAFFSGGIRLSEPMKLELLMGYDGPFRLWIDGKCVFTDMDGTNPCLPDESRQTIALPRGPHRIDIGMDINRGQAWGFFLRMIRKDITPTQIASGSFAKPTFYVPR